MKKILEHKIRLEIEQKDIEPNSKNIKESVDQYINSNNKIIKFFSENFLNKPYFKDELVLLEKTKYDMLLFQIDEAKMTAKSLKKQIEQMEMDNYLVNIDILRMKSQLDAYKTKNKRYEKDKGNTIKEEKNENDDNNNDLNKSKDSIKSGGSKKNKILNENSDNSSSENDIDDDIVTRKPSKSVARKGIMTVGTFDPSAKALETTKKF